MQQMKFSIDDVIDFYVKTINLPEGKKIKVGLTPLSVNKKSFNGKIKKDITTVRKDGNIFIAKYPFIIEDLAKELDIKVEEIFYIKGWIDADGSGDEKITINCEEEVFLEVEKVIFVGFIHETNSNKVHLLTQKDIDKYKIQTRNPVTKALENQHPMIQGSGSIFAGLYGFGDWASRITGFRDWQLDNIENEEQKEASKEAKYTLEFIKYILSNENGSFEIFTKSVKKYIEQNPQYVIGRFLTSTALGLAVKPKPTTTRVPVGFVGITAPAIWGDITFSAKEIDDFAKSIILGEQ